MQRTKPRKACIAAPGGLTRFFLEVIMKAMNLSAILLAILIVPLTGHAGDYRETDDPYYQSEGISHTFVFQSRSRSDFGEGFFFEPKDGKKVLIQSSPEDNPHDLANLKRYLQAVLKAGAKVTFPPTKDEELFLATKYSLGIERIALSPEQIRQAAGKAAAKGKFEKVALINYRSIQLPKIELTFPCAEISGTGRGDLDNDRGQCLFVYDSLQKRRELVSGGRCQTGWSAGPVDRTKGSDRSREGHGMQPHGERSSVSLRDLYPCRYKTGLEHVRRKRRRALIPLGR